MYPEDEEKEEEEEGECRWVLEVERICLVGGEDEELLDGDGGVLAVVESAKSPSGWRRVATILMANHKDAPEQVTTLSSACESEVGI